MCNVFFVRLFLYFRFVLFWFLCLFVAFLFCLLYLFVFFFVVHICSKKNQIPFLIFSLFSFFFFLTNIDECKTYPSKCQVNATCNSTHQMKTWIYWRCTQLFLFVVVVFSFNTVESQKFNFCNVT